MKGMLKNGIVILVLISLVGCSSVSTSDKQIAGVLKPIQQNERNTQIISSLGFDTLLMYDLDIKDEDIKMIHYWIEHYKNGEKQDDFIKGATSTKEKMTIAASKLDFNLEENTTYTRWTYSVSDGTAISTMESLPMEVKDKERLGMGSTWVDEKVSLEAEKPITLALLARYDGSGVPIGLDEEIIQGAINTSDEVFVVKVMISKSDKYPE